MEIVVAKYNEDVSWVKQFDKWVVYDKSETGNLPNVGGCDHTYLHHIITNYDSLANVTVFFTGGCVYRHDRFEQIHKVMNSAVEGKTYIDHFKLDYDELYNFKLDEYRHMFSQFDDPRLEPCDIRPYGKWMDEYVKKPINPNVQYGGVFCVTREDIHKNPKSFYERLILPLSKYKKPEAAHYMERAWSSIFV